jgi:hypothetical protein
MVGVPVACGWRPSRPLSGTETQSASHFDRLSVTADWIATETEIALKTQIAYSLGVWLAPPPTTIIRW